MGHKEAGEAPGRISYREEAASGHSCLRAIWRWTFPVTLAIATLGVTVHPSQEGHKEKVSWGEG